MDQGRKDMLLEGRCTRPLRRRIRQRSCCRGGPERTKPDKGAAAAEPAPSLQRQAQALHRGRQRRRLSWLSNRAVVLGGEASGQQMGALQVRKCEWNSMVGPDFYAIRFRSPKP